MNYQSYLSFRNIIILSKTLIDQKTPWHRIQSSHSLQLHSPIDYQSTKKKPRYRIQSGYKLQLYSPNWRSTNQKETGVTCNYTLEIDVQPTKKTPGTGSETIIRDPTLRYCDIPRAVIFFPFAKITEFCTAMTHFNSLLYPFMGCAGKQKYEIGRISQKGKIKLPVSLRMACRSLVHGHSGVDVACRSRRRRCVTARGRWDSDSRSGASAAVRRRSLPLPWSCHGIDYLIWISTTSCLVAE